MRSTYSKHTLLNPRRTRHCRQAEASQSRAVRLKRGPWSCYCPRRPGVVLVSFRGMLREPQAACVSIRRTATSWPFSRRKKGSDLSHTVTGKGSETRHRALSSHSLSCRPDPYAFCAGVHAALKPKALRGHFRSLLGDRCHGLQRWPRHLRRLPLCWRPPS